MRFYFEIRNSYRLLLIHRMRSTLSCLGVLFGVASLIAMLAIGEGAKKETLTQIEQLGMKHIIIRQNILMDEKFQHERTSAAKGLRPSDAKTLYQNNPFANAYAPIKIVQASITGSHAQTSAEIIATSRAFREMKNLPLMEGRFICDLDQREKKLVCVLGYEIAKNLGSKGHINQTLRLNHVNYEIVGVLQSTHWKAAKNQVITTRNIDQTIFIPLGSENGMESSPRFIRETLSEIILQIQEIKNMENAANLIRKEMKRSERLYENYQVIIPQELLKQALRTHKTFNLVLGSIAAISLVVGGIGIMNIMLATVSERTKEIGIRRAMGANKRHILVQFLLETLLLTSLGAVLGILVGIAGSISIVYIADWTAIISGWSILLALSMSVCIGLCSGLYPAYQAANMDPIRALRSE